MLSGKRFRLKRETLSIETIGEDRRIVLIPVDGIVTVLSGPRPDDKRMVDVTWENRTLVMFAIDLQIRGQEITDKGAIA